jgi:hypothetical protein
MAREKKFFEMFLSCWQPSVIVARTTWRPMTGFGLQRTWADDFDCAVFSQHQIATMNRQNAALRKYSPESRTRQTDDSQTRMDDTRNECVWRIYSPWL